MELIKSKALATGELTASGTNYLEFAIPGGFRSWSLHIVPVHTGGGTPDDPTVHVQYYIAGAWRALNGETPAAVVKNTVGVVSRDDAIGRVRVAFLNGVAVVDGGMIVQLWGVRSN